MHNIKDTECKRNDKVINTTVVKIGRDKNVVMVKVFFLIGDRHSLHFNPKQKVSVNFRSTLVGQIALSAKESASYWRIKLTMNLKTNTQVQSSKRTHNLHNTWKYTNSSVLHTSISTWEKFSGSSPIMLARWRRLRSKATSSLLKRSSRQRETLNKVPIR